MGRNNKGSRDELNNYYYNGNDLLSYNASISFIMGERASGKSFFFKRKLIDDFIKYGRTAVYVRREGVQIENACKTLFDDVISSDERYQKYEFTLTGTGNKMEWQIDGKTFCILLNLKSFNKYKGVYFDSYNMFFDEFIEESGFYLKDESQAFYSLISTVFRDREEFRIYMASNSISYYCWLFEEFGIRPHSGQRFFTASSGKDKNGNKIFDFVLELSEANEKRTQDMNNSRLGRLYKNANLDSYMLSNEALKDNMEHIEPNKPLGYDIQVCCFSFSNKIYGVWSDFSHDIYYIYPKYSLKIDNIFKVYMTEQDKKEGWVSIRSARNYNYIKRIKNHYYDGSIKFDSQVTKVDFIENILKYL